MENTRIYEDLGLLRMWIQVSDSTGSNRVEVFWSGSGEVPTKGE